jgi:long-subunit acyl-CoA synthetase (AMP-forming)
MIGRNGTIQPSSDSCWGRPSSSSGDPSSVQEAYELSRAEDRASVADDDGVNPWHSLLYDRLRDRALPALIADDTITPAASLWTGSRLWLDSFRSLGLKPGDRLLLSMSPSAAFVQVFVAAIWQGLSLVMLRPGANVEARLAAMDARAAVVDIDTDDPSTAPSDASLSHTWQAKGPAGPQTEPKELRPTDKPRTPHARFFLSTSGTTGEPTWVALSDRNVLSVLASHMPHLALCNARTLSVLPWSHAFGLVLDFLPALLSEAEIIRDPYGGRDPEELLRLARAWGATHLSSVPLVIDRLSKVDGGPDMLCSLEGGIVGGAPVSGEVAQLLSGTSLRAGYGQTEASPGIALGPPGSWSANYLGRPLGCDTRVDDRGELHFQGDNACIGVWKDGALQRRDPERTVATGDLVSCDGDDLFFRGRTDQTFKLSNGRLVAAGKIEADLEQRFDTVDEAFLYTPDGHNVAIAVRLSAPDASLPSTDAIRAAVGSVGERLLGAHAVPADRWKTTPKGTVARQEMKAFLQRTFSERASSSFSPPFSSS